MEDFAESMGQSVRAVLGDTVEVKAVNLFSREADQYPEVLDYVRKHPGVGLPLIAINGKVRFGARASTQQIIKALREETTA